MDRPTGVPVPAPRRLLVAAFLVFISAAPASAAAQVIQLKTVPIATGNQFMVFPSSRLGMADVSIAVEDALLDPFVNPAKGVRNSGTRLFGSPSFYHLTGDNGGAKTLPVGMLFGGEWFGGVAFALQELEGRRANVFGPFPVDALPGGPPLPGQGNRLSERSARNVYAFSSMGRRVGEHTSVAASVFWAGLEAVEGVDMLYPLRSDLDQDGDALGVRLGVLHEWAGDERSLEALVLYDRWDMVHDVTSVDWVWDPSLQQPELTTIEETNLDRTDTWGMQLRYVQPLSSEGWRIGGLLTGNYKSHPKIPDYEIQNIPRDPGDSWAGNFGLGLAKVDGPATFALDLVYEPIRSDTWQEADTETLSVSGRVIRPGERTIDNHFSFSNALIRLGAGYEQERYEVQAGLALRSINYELDQTDRVRERRRDQEESWLEWTPTWGGALTLDEIEIRYFGRLTSGTGLPGVAFTGRSADAVTAAPQADFILAPSAPLTLNEATVFSHQLTISLPVGR